MFDRLDRATAARLADGSAPLLHTDSHFWKFLYPLDASADRCVMFDWPLWQTGLGGWDLGYMIAQHLYPEHRQRFEPHLLEHYAHALASHGVTRSLDDVTLDYRVGVAAGLLMPIMEFTWKIPPVDWLPKLEKCLSAFEAHHCDALLRRV